MPQLAQCITLLGYLLLAPRCLVCGERGLPRQDLCAVCTQALPWNNSSCNACGLPMPFASARCGHCQRTPPAFTRVRAVFRYEFPVDRLLPRFKFHGDLAAGALLAELMASTLPGDDLPQALVPVPLHPARLRERGYDQARELARALGARLRVPVLPLLARPVATAAQTRLGAAARRQNVRAAFRCRAGPLPSHVALVDDVMTTGATVHECADVLRHAGVARIDVWVVARAAAPA